MITDCTAIIMVGGDSRRMGTDKANVTLGEKTLLQTVIATMQQLSRNQSFLAGFYHHAHLHRL
jgi:molybdopterin-guanine dinucleotide biosynthesis protein A